MPSADDASSARAAASATTARLGAPTSTRWASLSTGELYSRTRTPVEVAYTHAVRPVPILVPIPEGGFWTGWEGGLPAERPRHRVWVSGFAIAVSPATNAEYALFLQATGHAAPPFWNDPRFRDPAQPVVGVNWVDAAWLTPVTGREHRLPTEAEWEKAARRGIEAGGLASYGPSRTDAFR